MCIRLATCAQCGHGFADVLKFRNSVLGRVAHLICRACLNHWIELEPLETLLRYPPDSAARKAPGKDDSQSFASLVFRSSN